MQSAVSEATGFVHYARAARFFPQVRLGIKVSEPVRQSGRGRGSPCWIRGGADVQGRGRRATEAGLRRPHLPPRKAQSEGDAGERARGAACMGGEARHGSGLAEAAPASPQGAVRRDSAGGEVRGAGVQGSGGMPWKRACGRPLLLPRKAQSEGAVQETTGCKAAAPLRSALPLQPVRISCAGQSKKAGLYRHAGKKNRKKRPAQADCLCGSALWDEREEYISSFIPFS